MPRVRRHPASVARCRSWESRPSWPWLPKQRRQRVEWAHIRSFRSDLKAGGIADKSCGRLARNISALPGRPYHLFPLGAALTSCRRSIFSCPHRSQGTAGFGRLNRLRVRKALQNRTYPVGGHHWVVKMKVTPTATGPPDGCRKPPLRMSGSKGVVCIKRTLNPDESG